MTKNVAVTSGMVKGARTGNMSDAEVSWRLEIIKKLKNERDEIIAQIETLQDEVKAEMTVRGVDELRIGAFKAIWKLQEPRMFDTAAFKVDHGDLYEQYRRPSPRRPFDVK